MFEKEKKRKYNSEKKAQLFHESQKAVFLMILSLQHKLLKKLLVALPCFFPSQTANLTQELPTIVFTL